VPPSPTDLLEFLFLTIARKPPRIGFREGAAVARYLDLLGAEFEGGSEKALLWELSKVIWKNVFQRAEFKAAQKG
jgi:hypothetical protein